jgi:hypothetical protein
MRNDSGLQLNFIICIFFVIKMKNKLIKNNDIKIRKEETYL